MIEQATDIKKALYNVNILKCVILTIPYHVYEEEKLFPFFHGVKVT